MTSDRFEPESIREKLSRLGRDPAREWHRRGDLEFPGLDEAAVLIPLSEIDGELHAVFTHRSRDLESHSGEVSFPGGREESGDNTLVETAMREAYEEIGLQPSDVEIFGALTEMPTVTGFGIVAYVGEFPHPYELVPSPAEIESMFRAPLRQLADPSLHRIEEREWGGTVYPVHFFEYESHTIWGATGWILVTLLEFLDLVDSDRTTLD